MSDWTYQEYEAEQGTHILIFADGLYDHKVFVSNTEYNPDSIAHVLGEGWVELAVGTKTRVVKWLRENPDAPAKMVALGRDKQILSISEFLSMHD